MIASIVVGYLAGSLSAGIIVARIMGLGDPREGGSGNPGTTNLLRLGGKKAAIITLLADALKGVLPVLAAQALGLNSLTLALVGLAAFLGHLYPVFFGFRGGKGIATGFGVMLAWSLPAGIAALLTWAFIAAVFRLSSLAALVSFSIAPVYLWGLSAAPTLALASAVMAGLAAWRHRGNIQRLKAGTEPKIGG
ncbi:MAG: glycerol-3-phosphate 1-O-acyltransferase PlsY [Spiribacter sp.]|nr:glycerol-3-phosphate 1-O-acyltransferase PlsY [Spiribacter sp.]MDR9490077.1 glycerol-3-phosphate 1-O-acyltransferase PlsY [Spiribacter sp.]